MIDRSGCPSPRHGEYWMAAKYGCTCFDTRVAYSAWRQAFRGGQRRIVDATAATRICQGLPHYGYTAERIVELSGVSERLVRELQTGRKTTLLRTRDKMLRAVASRARLDVHLHDYAGSCARRNARRRGWVPLAAWDDDTIGDPSVEPDLGALVDDAVDEVAVARAVRGERLRLNQAEEAAALRLGLAQGETLTSVSKRLGINYLGAQILLAGGSTPGRAKRARVEAEVLRVGGDLDDREIAAVLDVHPSTVASARLRLAQRQPQLVS